MKGEDMNEKTLAIIKPDATKKKIVGKIIQKIEEENFQIQNMKMLYLTKEDAKGFYVVHKDKPFYESLTEFMSSGTIVATDGGLIKYSAMAPLLSPYPWPPKTAPLEEPPMHR